MGLLKVGVSAAQSVLADQWREYFYCPSMAADVLVKKGEKRQEKKNLNNKGSDNIITNGSVIAVNEGQCMIIVDQGAIAEVCTEAGEFVYDTSTEPTIFYGGFGEGLKRSFEQFKVWGRTRGFISLTPKRSWAINTVRPARCLSGWWTGISVWILISPSGATASIHTGSQILSCFTKISAAMWSPCIQEIRLIPS